MSLRSLFSEHPASVGETYLVHLGHASRFALQMMIGGGACLVHSVLPFLFANTASHVIAELHQRMLVDRRGVGRVAAPRDGSTSAS
ncbi:MAG: DUF6356 family protein [Steroidobacteraceae bacterium]